VRAAGLCCSAGAPLDLRSLLLRPSSDRVLVIFRQGALDDFRARIRKYEEVYETITNRDLHYIKLIDMYEP